MPFDSRKQQKWYHATNQTFYDDKPHSARLVKKGGSKSEEGEEPEFKDLTTTAGGDLDPQNKNLQTTQGSMKESLVFEGKEYKLSPEGHIPEDDDLKYEDKIYTEVTHEDKELKRRGLLEQDELASEYSYKEMRESLLKNDVKQILRKAVEEFKEDEHPREKGKFTSKGGGDSGGKSEAPKEEKPKQKKERKLLKSRTGNWYVDLPLEKQHRQNLIDDSKERIDRIKEDKDYYKAKKKIGKVDDMSDEELSKYNMWMGGRDVWDSKFEPKDREAEEPKRFTLSSYRRNEGRNAHGANALNLTKQYGTPEEIKELEEINTKHEKNEEIDMSDYRRRHEISGKYYKNLLEEDKALKQEKSKAKEESIASVSGPPADSTMRIMSGKTHVRPEGKFVDEIIDENLQAEDDLTSDTLTDKVLGEEDQVEYEGEVYIISPRGYSPNDKDLIFEGKIYKATEGIGNCQFCAGKGQITVENLGIKECPDCDGTGDIQQSTPAPDITGQMDPNVQPQQPTQEVPQQEQQEVPQEPQPDQQTQKAQIPQQPIPQEQQAPPQQAPEEKEFPPKEEKPKFGEAKATEGGKDEMRNWLEGKGIIGPDDEVKQHHEDYYNKQMQATKDELKSKGSEVKIVACEKSMKQFRGYIAREIEVLTKKAKANEAVSIMYGLPTIEKSGKRIKGILAYAGVSLNDRIYLPEELAKGHGLTLPLLLNHSNIAGAEEELDRLDDDMVSHLEDERDYKIGEVTLRWDQEKLTLFYEGVIEHEFFQKEVDDADMAVSLGIYYDSDSPVVCDDNCYTIIKGAEFREVSLVYHPGFPIATIEAVERELKESIINKQKAKEDHLEKLEQLKKNEEKEQANGEDEKEDIKLVKDVIEDVEEGGIAEENEEDIIITNDQQTLDLVTQVPSEDWNADDIVTENNFSIRGINGFTISNSNGVTRYTLDSLDGYENNWLHVNVNKEGAKLYGEEFQLQPKMTTPPELTKEIENHPDIKFTDSDADAFKKK